jgi:hypothetical protein
VPSLPSIQRTSTQPSGKHKAPSSGQLASQFKPPSKPPSRPPLGAKPPSAPHLGTPQASMRMPMSSPMSGPAFAAPPPARSNALVIVLVGVLVAAIAVLAYLVLTK